MEKPIPAIKVSVVQLQCTKCGVETHAACDCGVDYKPKTQRAAEAIAAHPEMSNRAIASQIGADEKTVRKARSGADQSAPETVTGKDNKQYPARRDGDSLEYGQKQVARLQQRYGDPAAYSEPIQYDLLEKAKPPCLEMNWPTREAFARWFDEHCKD